jgi:hypothetical protein
MKHWLFILLLFMSVDALAQKQLLLMKRERVVARFTEGEYFRCKLKNKEKKEGRILELTPAQIITSNDTLDFLAIESIKVKRQKNMTSGYGIGKLLLIMGVGFFAIDQANTLIVKGQSGVDEGVAYTSLALAASGAAFMFIRSPYKKVYGRTLKTVDYHSRFYRYPDK